MDQKTEPVSSPGLFFRYLILALVSITSIAMVGASLWTVRLFVRYADIYPGIEGENLNHGVYQDIYQIRQRRGVAVVAVDSNSSAQKAGLKPGDLILAVNGIKLKDRPRAFYGAFLETIPGREIRVELVRNGLTRNLVLTPGKSRPAGLSWTYLGLPIKGSTGKEIWALYLPWLLLQLLFLVVGILIGWSKPKNRLAFQCSVLLLFAGDALFLFDTPFLAFWPFWALAGVLLFQNFSSGLVLPLTLRMLSIFPNPTRLGRTLLKWQAVPFLLFGIYLFAESADDLAGLFGSKSSWLVTNPVSHFFANIDQWLVVVFFLLSGSLLVAQRIDTRNRPRSRLQVIELGFLLGVAGVLVFLVLRPVLFDILPESWHQAYSLLTLFLCLIFFSATPVSFVYAIIARKVFGIRLILRKGLQYLFLSRGALLVEGIIIFLILQKVLKLGQTRLPGSLTLLSALALGIALFMVLVLGQVNRKIMPALDRRFFREVYDVRRLLLELGEQLSGLKVREKILRRTSATLLKALHPVRVLLFLKEKSGQVFKCVLVLENGRSRLDSIEQLEVAARPAITCELRSEDAIVQLLKQGQPWANVYPEQLSPEVEEEKRLSELKCELLVSLPGTSGILGLMGLGPRLSEEPFSRADKELLLTVARQMGLALENAELLEVAKREAELSRDLEIARQVQQNLFPKNLPSVPGWEFAGICRPARAVGGDYYDIFEPAPGKLLFALGDVSGKGLGAALLMADIHATIRSLAALLLDRLPELVGELNDQLLSETTPEDYLTLFLGLLELKTGELRYVNCGHPAAILSREEEKKQERLDQGGPILGALDRSDYKEGHCQLKPGDVTVVYSDGITEAENKQGEMFEEKGLLQVLNDIRRPEASAIMELILRSVDDFTAQSEQADDISLVVIHRSRI